MQYIKIEIPQKLKEKARKYSEFKKEIEMFLLKNNLYFNKFSITEDDYYIGYITENIITNYLKKTFKNYSFKLYSEQFNIESIKNILLKNHPTHNEITYVKNYFYDKYDLSATKENKELTIDIKSAKTYKIPFENWNYLYPVSQTKNKDVVILTYINNNYIALIGYQYINNIKKCNIIKQNNITKFGTLSNIDNYETFLKYYKPLEDLFQ